MEEMKMRNVPIVGLLFAAAGAVARFFANGSPQAVIEELENKLVNLNEKAKAIQAQADADHRELTQEEQAQIEQICQAFDGTKIEIARRRRIMEQESALSTPAPRISQPADLGANASATPAPSPRSPITGGDLAAARSGTWGFRSFGEFASCVKRGVRGTPDPRLLIGNGPSPFSQEGIGEDGGFTVPPDFRTEIMTKVYGEESLLGRCDQQTSSGNQITIPKDETTQWQDAGGVQAYWENEAAQMKASKIELQSTTVRLNKLTALVPVTSELLEDANALGSYLRRKAPEKMDYKVSDAIINGKGVGQPLGFLNASCKIEVAKVLNQTNGTVVLDNIQSMFARAYSKSRSKMVWLINQDVEPFLQGLKIEGAAGGVVPVYLPPGGLSAAPYATLLGRPVIPHEVCQAVGTPGDIMLVDFSSYLAVTKAGGVRQDVSIHLWFDYDVTAFRFIMRIGGQPWWTSPIKRAHGTNTLSCCVTLAQR